MSGASYHDHGPHGHAHPHAHGGGTTALGWALAITIAFMFIEAIGGLLSHSLALLADAAHMLTDAGALGLALFAAWISRRPPTAARTFGFLRVEILAAAVNATILLVVTIGIIWEAVQRMMRPEAVQPGLMFVVALAGFIANIVAARMLHGSRGESLNVRGAYLHVLSDLAGSLAAMLAAGIIAATGWVRADPVLSIALSALLLVSGVRLLLQAVDVLLETAPRHVDMNALQSAIASVPGVDRVHDLHVWTVASGMVAMSGHAVVIDPLKAQQALDQITERVRKFGIGHTTIQLENVEGGCVGCEVPERR